MIEVHENLFDITPTTDALVCTINRTLKRDGTLVMGKGVAKQFAAYWPHLPRAWGSRVNHAKIVADILPSIRLAAEGVKQIDTLDRKPLIGIGLPTKVDWRNLSIPKLIVESCEITVGLVEVFGLKEIRMPPLGCGNGGLRWADVKPLLTDILDDRFVICLP